LREEIQATVARLRPAIGALIIEGMTAAVAGLLSAERSATSYMQASGDCRCMYNQEELSGLARLSTIAIHARKVLLSPKKGMCNIGCEAVT
jgi:hypothetical protein